MGHDKQQQVEGQGVAPEEQRTRQREGSAIQRVRYLLAQGTTPQPKYIADLIRQYADERDAIIELLQQNRGNGYVLQVVLASLVVPERERAAPAPVRAAEYWERFGRGTTDRVLQRAMSEFQVELAPGLWLPESERGAFVMAALGAALGDASEDGISRAIGSPLVDLIENSRVLDVDGEGLGMYDPVVTDRILERLSFAFHHATRRLSGPYLRARAPLLAAPWLADTEPRPDELGARSPLEYGVAKAMCGGFLSVAPRSDASGPAVEGPQPVILEFESSLGPPRLVTVAGGAATAADVANALFGDPAYERYVVGHGDRYAFSIPPGVEVLEPYRQTIDEQPLARAPIDPLTALDGPTADARALESAAELAPGDPAQAVALLTASEDVLARIAFEAGPLGASAAIAAERARIAQRREACASTPGEAERWAAHGRVQLAFLLEAEHGVHALTEYLGGRGVQKVSTTQGDQLVDILERPALEVGAAFGAAITAADQLDLAFERLEFAKERLAMLPIDEADQVLGECRRRIARTTPLATLTTPSYDAARLATLEHRLQDSVSALRTSLMNGDGTAYAKLGELRGQLAMLDLQTSLGSMLSQLELLKSELFASESWAPSRKREYAIYDELNAALAPWRLLAVKYDTLWAVGAATDPDVIESISAEVRALKRETKIPELVEKVASFQEDEGKRQRLIAIGISIAAIVGGIVVGLATGAMVEGLAGEMLATVLESVTATTINSTLDPDPSFGSFAGSLALNAATAFGGRGIQRFFRADVEAEAVELAKNRVEQEIKTGLRPEKQPFNHIDRFNAARAAKLPGDDVFGLAVAEGNWQFTMQLIKDIINTQRKTDEERPTSQAMQRCVIAIATRLGKFAALREIAKRTASAGVDARAPLPEVGIPQKP